MTETTDTIKTFPVNLFLEKRPVLIIGGGNVALRKVKRLLEAGAEVHLVAERICEDLRSFGENERLHLAQKSFQEADLDFSPALVYAATANGETNRRILTLCKARGLLCCAVDKQWRDGDFLTPASTNAAGISIAVSTGGRSCIRSRMIKDSISRHADLVCESEFVVIGTDHRLLPLEQREPLHIMQERRHKVGEMLSHLHGVHEVAVVNTCNRIEVYAVMAPREPLLETICRILDFDHLNPDGYYTRKGHEAYRHLTRVLAGLYSQAPCEKHIVSQVKEAWNESRENKWGGNLIDKILNECMHVSRRVREEAEPLVSLSEIEDMGLEYAREKAGDFNNKKIGIIGTGNLGKALAKRLCREGASVTMVYRRSIPQNLPSDIPVYPLEKLNQIVSRSNIVFTALSSSEPILTSFNEQLPLIIDLGSPRNVSANLNPVDLDAIKEFYHSRHTNIQQLHTIADKVIANYAKRFPDFSLSR